MTLRATSRGSIAIAGVIAVLWFGGNVNVHSGTGFMPVPVEGTLLCSQSKVLGGQITEITFSVTPLVATPSLDLSFDVPPGLESVSGRLSRRYTNVEANEAIVFRAQLRVKDSGAKRVIATASVLDTAECVARKAFVCEVNSPKSPRGQNVMGGVDHRGATLRIRSVLAQRPGGSREP